MSNDVTSRNSLSTWRNSNLSASAVLADLTPLSEALVLIGKLVALIPQGNARTDKPYLLGLADILVRYPRAVTSRIADSYGGAAQESDFLPTPKGIKDWCEKEVAALWRVAQVERQIEAQRAKHDLEPDPPEVRERVKIGFKRLVDALKEKEISARRDYRLSSAETHNRIDRIFFERECRGMGLDPAQMACSPSLLAILNRPARGAHALNKDSGSHTPDKDENSPATS